MLSRVHRRLMRLGPVVLAVYLVSCSDESAFVNKETAAARGGLEQEADALAADSYPSFEPTEFQAGPFVESPAEPSVDNGFDDGAADIDPFVPPVDPVVVVPNPTPVPTPDPTPVPSPVRVIVDTSPVVVTEGESRVITVSVDDGSGARQPQAGEVTSSSNNPWVANPNNGSQPNQIVIVGGNPGQTQVIVSTGDDTKVIPVQVVPGVAAVRVGVNFEDHPFSGDKDFNDAVLCFTGKVAVSPGSVVSLVDQTIAGVITQRSACDADMTIRITGPGSYSWVTQLRISQQPTYEMPFKAGSTLEVIYNPVAGCGDNGRTPVSMYNPQWAQILPNVCRTTGQ